MFSLRRSLLLVEMALVGYLVLSSAACEPQPPVCSACGEAMGWDQDGSHRACVNPRCDLSPYLDIGRVKCPNCNHDIAGPRGTRTKCSNCGDLVEIR